MIDSNAEEVRAEEREIGSGVLDLLEESSWLQRHEAAVAIKVIERVHDYVPENVLASIRDEWGIGAGPYTEQETTK